MNLRRRVYARILATATALLAQAAPVMASPVWQRFVTDLVERPGGPMTFRFFLQPAMALLAAWKDGKRDAETGRSPYFWTVLSNRELRGERLREGFRSTARILALGVGMDLIYQWIALKHFYPMEAIVVAVVLAFLPYLIMRGPFARLVRRRKP